MKRRDFILGATSSTSLLYLGPVNALTPCPPQLVGGATNNPCTVLDAEQDWIARIGGPGVVWYHNFASAAEVDNFRWKGGVGNDPNDLGTPGTVLRQTSDGVTGGGCLEVFRRSGTSEGAVWWRPYSPITGSGNGRGSDDPGANGTLPAQPYSPTQAGSQIQNWTNNARPGYYGHGDYHNGTRFDGTDYYLQMRVKMDPRRMTGGNESSAFFGGKILYLTLTSKSLTGQEIVTMSNGGGGGPTNYHRVYTAGSPSLESQDSEGRPGHQVGSDLADYGAGTYCHVSNSPQNCWGFSEGWDTLLYHITPGHDGPTSGGIEDTRIQVYAANPGDTSYTKIWDVFLDINFEEAWDQGWNGLICSGYNNNLNLPQDFWFRFDEIIFSKEWIPCPQS